MTCPIIRATRRRKRNERVAKNFKKFVALHFPSQYECAHALGVSRGLISHYCTGNVAVSTRVIHRLVSMFPNEIKYYDFRELSSVVKNK